MVIITTLNNSYLLYILNDNSKDLVSADSLKREKIPEALMVETIQ